MRDEEVSFIRVNFDIESIKQGGLIDTIVEDGT